MAKKTNPDEGSDPKEKGNVYDKIFKENATSIFLPLIEITLGIKIISFAPMRAKKQTTIEREMDFLYEVLTAEENRFILHIEFQDKYSDELMYRISEYHGITLRKKRLPTRHIVIYLGRDNPAFLTNLPEELIFKGYEVIHLHRLDSSLFLSSQLPEVIILAILSYYPPERTEAVLRLLLKRLHETCLETGGLEKYISQLIVLSRLRGIEDFTIKICDDMSLHIDIEKDTLYKKGMEKGMEKMRDELEAMKDEIDAKDRLFVTYLLQTLQLDDASIAATVGVTHDFVSKIRKELGL